MIGIEAVSMCQSVVQTRRILSSKINLAPAISEGLRNPSPSRHVKCRVGRFLLVGGKNGLSVEKNTVVAKIVFAAKDCLTQTTHSK